MAGTGRSKGSPRVPGSGRKKGTPNKNTLDAKATAERLGVDPFEILCRFAQGDWKGLGYDAGMLEMFSPQGNAYYVPVISPDLRVTAAKEAVKYLIPQRKAVEHSGPGGQAIAIDGQTEIVLKWMDETDFGNAPPDSSSDKG